jgi:hypothetical protein
MSITALTLTDAAVTAADDGTLFDALAHGADCILSGCTLSAAGSSGVGITAGYLLVKGRVCKVAAENIAVKFASSGTQTKSLYVNVRPEEATPAAFSNTYIDDDDINADESGDYSALLCTYTATTTAVTAVAPQMFLLHDRVALFTGGASATSGTVGNLITPAADIANFKTLYIMFRAGGNSVKIVPLEQLAVGGSVDLREVNLADTPGSTTINIAEIKLKRNATTLEILAAGWFTWTGAKDAAADRAETFADMYIVAIYGSYV